MPYYMQLMLEKMQSLMLHFDMWCHTHKLSLEFNGSANVSEAILLSSRIWAMEFRQPTLLFWLANQAGYGSMPLNIKRTQLIKKLLIDRKDASYEKYHTSLTFTKKLNYKQKYMLVTRWGQTLKPKGASQLAGIRPGFHPRSQTTTDQAKLKDAGSQLC